MTESTPVDIGEVAVDNAASYLDETNYPQSAAMLRALRAALTAAEKLLRDVGTDGRFSLSAVNSDEADAWYDERDAFLSKGVKK